MNKEWSEKSKFNDKDKNRIKSLNVVSADEEASWLIDYWCEKDIKGRNGNEKIYVFNCNSMFSISTLWMWC